jgi:hypothetical protein
LAPRSPAAALRSFTHLSIPEDAPSSISVEPCAMTPFEFRSAALSNTVEVWASDTLVGVVRHDNARGEWLAEVDGQSRHWPSFGKALNFIEAVLQTGTWLELRSPDLVLH